MNLIESENMDFLCPVCALDFPTKEEFDDHKKKDEHRVNWLNRQYRHDRLKYVENKFGITIDVICENANITYHPNKYIIEVVTQSPIEGSQSDESRNDKKGEEVLSFTFRVNHNGDSSYYITGIDTLNRVRLIESETEFIIEDQFQMSKRRNILKFQPGNRYDVSCSIKPGAIVRALHIPVLFEFLPIKEMDEPPQPFYIGKTVEVKGAAYEVRNFGTYVPGVYPQNGVIDEERLERNMELKYYDIPPWFQVLAFNNTPAAIRNKMHIVESVTSATHKNFFRTLLWLEELQQELDIQFYSRKGVTFDFNYHNNVSGLQLVELIETGLGENRPCVMVKDKVFVCLSTEAARTDYPQWYEGIVHQVGNTSISLGFHQTRFFPMFDSKTKFNLEYSINRHSTRVCHRALDLCSQNSLYKFLFPKETRYDEEKPLPQIVSYDQNINNNMEQIQAIQHIVAGSSGSSPYVIFGPPGTGKTVTVVEAIKQVLYLVDGSYVLACAPSNTAADVMTERLLDHFDGSHVMRIYAESRVKFKDGLPEKVKNASCFAPNIPFKKELMKKRVIVCTFITAAKIASAEFPASHFTHVFLDEVGHAMECEAIVGVAGILPAWGNLIMAGDPHQLGPVIRNLQGMSGGHIFPHTGLDTSLLERIMAIPQYQQDEGSFNPKYVTKLVKNYRSHHTILEIPNELFYNSELEAKGSDELVNYFINWKYLPKKGFPIIFRSVAGEDKMERHSPSYHNPEELKEVLEYLRKLLRGTPKVEPAQIGIITPYRLQVEKLRKAVRKLEEEFVVDLSQLKIGSVEDFQGEERRVIIISTVRATNRHLGKDQLFKLGFLKNPKRFNVAVTRAQCLLILVGCAGVLMLDSNWKKLILYIQSMGGFSGAPIKEVPRNNIDDIIHQMEHLNIRPTVGDISLRQVVEVPSWHRS